MKNLYIIVNERISSKKNFFFCENKDIQSIVNFLSCKYNVFLISRSSSCVKPFKLEKIYKVFNLNLMKILFFFLFLISKKNSQKKILIISITPFNFIIFILFKFFSSCKFYLYLRSNGYEEYNSILGKKYIWIYDFMFKYITRFSEVISCHKNLYKKKCHILRPSELSTKWKKKITKKLFDKNDINVLYVGRFKIEKGIYSLLDLFSKLPKNIKLTIVGSGDLIQTKDNRVKTINFINDENKLIKTYDEADIVILPSYTEAHPKVIDEALSRLKPVIIFNEIKHVIGSRLGIFSSERNYIKLKNKIIFIKRNYDKIVNDIKKNKLPTKITFLNSLAKIIRIN